MSRWRCLLLLASLTASACGGSSDAAVPGPGADAAPVTPPGADADAAAPPPTAPTPTPTLDYFPPPSASGSWETTTAAAAGFDQAKLDELATFVEQSKSTTFTILFDGRILLEKYWAGATATTLKDVASAQKSVLSLLMGTLIANGTLSLDDTVTSVLGEGWSNAAPAQEAPITLRHILTMTSGLDGSLGYAAPAGSAWLYNTDAYHRSGMVVEKKTGKTLEAYTRARLFDPIGAGASAWSTRGRLKDSKGLPVDSLDMNARDMARVGLLVMHGGTWEQRVLVPGAYLPQATTPSQAFNPSYGFLFWLNGQASALLPPAVPYSGMLMPSAPADLVAALGANDQKIHVSRASKLVVVRQGAAAGAAAAAATGWDELLWQRISAARMK